MNRARSEKAAADATSLPSNAYNGHAYDLNWVGVVRFTVPTLGLVAILGSLIAMTLSSGCASKKPDMPESTANLPSSDTPRSAVLEVGPASSSTPAYVPASSTGSVSTATRADRTAYVAPPVAAAYTPPTSPASAPPASEPLTTQTPTPLASTGAAVGLAAAGTTSYTVQKGDTLFRIAKDHYGDGKQWSRIAAANPGLSPANLKSGQKIVLP